MNNMVVEALRYMLAEVEEKLTSVEEENARLKKIIDDYRSDIAKVDDALTCNQMQADKVDDLTAELAEFTRTLRPDFWLMGEVFRDDCQVVTLLYQDDHTLIIGDDNGAVHYLPISTPTLTSNFTVKVALSPPISPYFVDALHPRTPEEYVHLPEEYVQLTPLQGATDYYVGFSILTKEWFLNKR